MEKTTVHYVVPVLLAVMLLLAGCQRTHKPPGNPPPPETVRRADALADGFRSPPDSVKPWVYWYWLSNNISREGITKDLAAMARVGIGEAFIGSIGLDDVPYG
jgi:hypothetical protein